MLFFSLKRGCCTKFVCGIRGFFGNSRIPLMTPSSRLFIVISGLDRDSPIPKQKEMLQGNGDQETPHIPQDVPLPVLNGVVTLIDFLTGCINLLIGLLTSFITGRGPPWKAFITTTVGYQSSILGQETAFVWPPFLFIRILRIFFRNCQRITTSMLTRYVHDKKLRETTS